MYSFTNDIIDKTIYTKKRKILQEIIKFKAFSALAIKFNNCGDENGLCQVKSELT